MSQVRSIVDRTIFQAAKGDRVNAANEPYRVRSSQVLKRPAPQGNGIGEKIDEEPMRDRLVVEWDVIKADLKVCGRSLLCGGGVVSREEDRKQGVKLFGLGVE